MLALTFDTYFNSYFFFDVLRDFANLSSPIIMQSLKYSMKQILRYKLASCWAKIELKLPIRPKKEFFGVILLK